MTEVKHNKIKLREVNRHLVCRLCRGYYVDATTIAECLHSFCRSCIIKYLEKNSFCPICEVQIHKTKPYLNLRLDKALQDVVYKLVPGLYHNEMKRRREFYSKHRDQLPTTTPEQCGLEERIIFSPEDIISFSMEYLESDDCENETVSSQSSESGDNPEAFSFPQQLGLMKLKNEGKNSRRESQDVQETSAIPKRYLQCPAVVNISHLKKFIRMKHDLTDKTQVDIIHKRVPLPDHYTLMDVAYIYTWKRSAPMRFFYQIYQTKKQKIKIPSLLPQEMEEKNPMASVRDNVKETNDSSNNKIQNGDLVTHSDLKINNVQNVQNGLKSETKPLVEEKCVKVSENGKVNTEQKSVSEVVSSVISEEEKIENVLPTNKKPVSCSVQNENSKSNSLSETEVNKKSESDKNKKPKTTNLVKEKELNGKERLLLNPISGQLESVPSTQNKPTVNGTTISNEKQKILDPIKQNVLNSDAKPLDTENQNDTKKSSVNLLKSFRKEKPSSNVKDAKADVKNTNGNSLTITTVTQSEKTSDKESVKVSVEIKAENKGSEYDFDRTSPPSKIIPLQEFSKHSKHYLAEHREKWLSKEAKNSWMSLQDFREQMLKENSNSDPNKKCKRKSVPSLYRIGTDNNKTGEKKTPLNEKSTGKRVSPTVINIQTESDTSNKTEIKIEAPKKVNIPRPIKIENKGGEYSIKQREDENSKKINSEKYSPEAKKMDDAKTKITDINSKETKIKSEVKNTTNEMNFFGAINLSKTDASPKNVRNSLENLMDMANKSGTPKSDEKMVEALISVAQKQSIEPLLKIPQYSQNLKTSQGSSPPGKNISSNDISQALQFFKDLRSDLKILEAKSQLSPNSLLEQFSQKSANLEPIQLYQQHIDLIRRLKRQNMAVNEADTPQRKQMKLSPPSEAKKKFSPTSDSKPKFQDETAQFKSSVERTLAQIQEQIEIQSRMVAAQNYKNLPALLQFYNRAPTFCPGPTSPSKSNAHKLKPSSHSPNSQKSPNSKRSPQSLTSPSASLPLPIPTSDTSFFNAQNYSHPINSGLTSEMTFHQMFQNYLSQQEKMNQIKHAPKKPEVPSPKSISEIYFGAQSIAKKPEPSSIPAAQKT